MSKKFTVYTARDVSFTDADVVNSEDIVFAGDYNPRGIKGYVIHVHGTVLAVVFAANLQEALDIAADAGKLASLSLTDDQAEHLYSAGEDNQVTCLGNYSLFFDLTEVSLVTFPCPALSIVALLKGESDG